MGEVATFRSATPVISVYAGVDGWMITIAPCPVRMPTTKHYGSLAAAMSRAVQLRDAHGWTIKVDGHQPGGAAA
jgi:hypothetical protein